MGVAPKCLMIGAPQLPRERATYATVIGVARCNGFGVLVIGG